MGMLDDPFSRLAQFQPSDYVARMPLTTEQDGEEAALDRLLESEPHSVSGHVRLGDLRARQGEADVARYYYRRALSFADCQDLSDSTAGDALMRVECGDRRPRTTGRSESG